MRLTIGLDLKGLATPFVYRPMRPEGVLKGYLFHLFDDFKRLNWPDSCQSETKLTF
jgi:hypothetical protein